MQNKNNMILCFSVVLAIVVLALSGCGNGAGGSGVGTPVPPAGMVFIPTKNIFMGEHEVTQKEWNDVMKDLETRTKKPSVSEGSGDDYPMYYVSWYEAIVYCNKLSISENKTPCYKIGGNDNPSDWGTLPEDAYNATWDAVVCDSAANGYRLPTEAEWEYAAKGGENFKYAGSDTLSDVAWYAGESGGKTHPVKGKPANGYGLYDMYGNVWEWCGDWKTVGSTRVFRGGGYDTDEEWSFKSNDYEPYEHPSEGGFRVVCAVK